MGALGVFIAGVGAAGAGVDAFCDASRGNASSPLWRPRLRDRSRRVRCVADVSVISVVAAFVVDADALECLECLTLPTFLWHSPLTFTIIGVHAVWSARLFASRPGGMRGPAASLLRALPRAVSSSVLPRPTPTKGDQLKGGRVLLRTASPRLARANLAAVFAARRRAPSEPCRSACLSHRAHPFFVAPCHAALRLHFCRSALLSRPATVPCHRALSPLSTGIGVSECA